MKKLLCLVLFFTTITSLLIAGCGTTGTSTHIVTSSSAQTSPVSATTSSTITSTSTSPAPIESSLSRIVIAPEPPASDPTSAYQPPPLTAPPQFTVIKAELVLGGSDKNGTNIPLGSTIYHWKNGITEAIGPDNSLLFLCRDADTTQIGTPGAGVESVTSIIQVPNGAVTNPGKYISTITDYSGNKVLATIIHKPEDFPYTPTLELSTKKQFTAIGTFADGSTRNITSQVTWNSSNTSIATVSSSGVVTALVNGNTNITASMNGITSVEVDLTVHSLPSISVSTWSGIGVPITLSSLPVGSTWHVYASGTFSDGLTEDITSQVTWTSSDKNIANIDSDGIITGVAAGSDTVTASLYGTTSPPIIFKVVSLSSITISIPDNMTAGSKLWLNATGTYSDGFTQGIQPTGWSSSNPAVATISNNGLATAIAAGTTNITAFLNGITSEPATLTVVGTTSTFPAKP